MIEVRYVLRRIRYVDVTIESPLSHYGRRMNVLKEKDEMPNLVFEWLLYMRRAKAALNVKNFVTHRYFEYTFLKIVFKGIT